MYQWTTSDGSEVWAWHDESQADYRAIWNPHKESVELLRSVHAHAGWPTVAVVHHVNDMNLALHIATSWRDLTNHIDMVK